MFKYKKLTLGIILLVTLQACYRDYSLPDKTQMKAEVPKLGANQARIYFFMGNEYYNHSIGHTFVQPLDRLSAWVHVNGEEIAYINQEDILICDVPAGQHELRWTPTRYHGAAHYNEEVTLTAEVKKNEILFLEANLRDVVSAPYKWMTAGALKGWTYSFEENELAGQEALKSRRIVGYYNIHSKVISSKK